MNQYSPTSHIWHFRKMQKSEMNDDPIQGEFFTNQSISDRLIRESIQNSLDARVQDGQAVVIRFVLGDSNEIGQEYPRGYFNALTSHLDATMETNAPGRQALRDLENNVSVPYLLIEDFNTTGLTGDVEQFSDPQSAAGSDINHFYWFVRNVARSGKRGLEGGSWGVGKYVFPDASKINTFFFLTRRSDDDQTIFMGQSVLKIHMLDEARLYPYGHFAEIDVEDEDFALPITDKLQVQKTKDDFGLTRNEETGLSVVVPFPQEGIDRNSLLRAVIRYYFIPILSDGLIVEVSDRSDDSPSVVVNHDTIYDIIDEIDWSDSNSNLSPQNRRRMFELAQNHVTISDQHRIVVKEPEPNRDPTRGEFSDRFDSTQLEDARIRFESGEELAFRIMVWVHPRNDSPKLSWLDLIVQRDPNLSGIHTEYVRHNLTIPDAGPRSLGISSNFRSLMVVEEENLAALLRDSEEPSHSRWNERAEKVRDRYNLGASTVRFVNGSVRRIIQCLMATQEGVHRNLLSEFFSIPRDGGRTGIRNGSAVRSRTPFEISERQGGFNVRVIDRGEGIPERLHIQVAYEIRRGNPLRRYDHRDFQLDSSDFEVVVDGCTIEEMRDNQIIVHVVGEGARITINGFDPNRDILVQVDTVESDS